LGEAFLTTTSLVVASLLALSLLKDEQLLDRDDAFDCGEVGLEDCAGAVLVRELDDVALMFESIDAVVTTESVEVTEVSAGLLSGKVNLRPALGSFADCGLKRVGDSSERNLR
jgi:hypothetical protein